MHQTGGRSKSLWVSAVSYDGHGPIQGGVLGICLCLKVDLNERERLRKHHCHVAVSSDSRCFGPASPTIYTTINQQLFGSELSAGQGT